jgi:hypothetical protein
MPVIDNQGRCIVGVSKKDEAMPSNEVSAPLPHQPYV